MKLPVITMSGQAKGEVEFADGLLIKDGKGTQAVHDMVTAYMANQRLGTASTKQISEVHGSGKKPWKQKGTGRARAGCRPLPQPCVALRCAQSNLNCRAAIPATAAPNSTSSPRSPSTLL